MTQPGETDEMSGIDHLRAVERHVGEGLVDGVIANTTPLPSDRLARYAAIGSLPVEVNRADFEARGVQLIEEELLADEEFIRHDDESLGTVILRLASDAQAAVRAMPSDDSALAEV